jgi:protease PrsW
MDLLLLILTIAPPLIIASYIVRSDIFPEPTSCVVKIFILGFILTIPAMFLNQLFIFNSSEDLSYLAGLTEESLKFLAFLLFISRKFNFNEKMDAIVYGALISLGFATLENFEYVYLAFPDTNSYSIAIIRAFTAIPLHALCGIIMGYFFGLHYFKHKPHYLIMAFIIPVLTHAAYNYTNNILLQLVIILIAFTYAKQLHRQFMSGQKGKKKEIEVKSKG